MQSSRTAPEGPPLPPPPGQLWPPQPECTSAGGRLPGGGRAAEDRRAEPGAGARAHAPARRGPEELSGPAAAAGARRRAAAAGRARAAGWGPRRARRNSEPTRWSCASRSCASRRPRPPTTSTRTPPAAAGAGRVEPGRAARVGSRVSAGLAGRAGRLLCAPVGARTQKVSECRNPKLVARAGPRGPGAVRGERSPKGAGSGWGSPPGGTLTTRGN